jgi:putative FmdB family regulatory protein
MPNYKFKCLACGHEFQKLLSPGHGKQKCLECGHHKTQKKLEAPGVQFKGEGFFLTDSKKKPEKKEGKSEKSSKKKD